LKEKKAGKSEERFGLGKRGLTFAFRLHLNINLGEVIFEHQPWEVFCYTIYVSASFIKKKKSLSIAQMRKIYK